MDGRRMCADPHRFGFLMRAARFAQRQGRENGQVELAVGARAAEELVGDQVGLANPQRQGQHHLFPHAP